jgi:hypothetical protein
VIYVTPLEELPMSFHCSEPEEVRLIDHDVWSWKAEWRIYSELSLYTLILTFE